MTPERKYLAALLRNAHVMEGQALTLLQTQIRRLENYREVVTRLRSYLEEISDHRSQLERCRHQLGEDKSPLMSPAIKNRANLPTFADWLSGDELSKHVKASVGIEYAKTKSYRWLSEAAHVAGEPEIAKICDGIVIQGWARAEWMWEQLPPRHHRTPFGALSAVLDSLST
jgi:ferritin-like metal-binding protein YciE